MKKPKICLISTVHGSFDIRVFYKESLTLAAAGYDVTLIIRNGENEVRDGVRIIALPSFENRARRMILSGFSAFRLAFRQRADVYHIQDPELLPVGLLLKIFTRGKVIYDVHEDLAKDILAKDWISPSLRGGLARIAKLFESASSVFFDAIVAATDDIRENFRNHRRSAAVRNYPSLDFPQSPPRPEDGIFRIIYVGCLAPERGIAEIVEAQEFLEAPREVRLVLCGEYAPLSYEGVLRRVPGFGRTDVVGWVNPKEARTMMGRADVGMLCYLPEENHLRAMPNKFFEYMIAGLPLICSDFPLWRKIVEENRCGLAVDPRNPREIAAAIETLRKNPRLRKDMGNNGRAIVLEKYNWGKEAGKLLGIYRDLLGERPR
jgi:glycosyltransferase involved in cell wall biosynthesis